MSTHTHIGSQGVQGLLTKDPQPKYTSLTQFYAPLLDPHYNQDRHILHNNTINLSKYWTNIPSWSVDKGQQQLALQYMGANLYTNTHQVNI